MYHFAQAFMMVSLGLLPIFFLPFTQEHYDTNKWFLLVGATIIVLILWGLRVWKRAVATVGWNGTVQRLGLVAATGLASLLVSHNKVEALLTPYGPGTLLALFLIAAIGGTFLDEKTRQILRWGLMTTVTLAGLVAIYQFFGLGGDPLWSPVGTSMGLVTTLIVTLPFIVHEAMRHKHAGGDTHMIIASVMAVVVIGGLALTGYRLLPTWSQTTLPYWANWQITLESYKNVKHLLVGVGADNFITAFTAGRPASLNATPLWNTRFMGGSTLLFHFATVYGVAGAAALVWFLVSLRRSLLAAGLFLVFLPPSFPAFVTFVILSMLSDPPATKHTQLPLVRYGGIALAASVFILGGYGLYRAYAAERAFALSLKAVQSRDGTAAYTRGIQAITNNPHISRFHTTYSQTNLALATAIANAASDSADPAQRDGDRQTSTQLVQQAIREAKISVNLAPSNVLAWEALALVYQSLIGVAQGADQWAIAAYQRAAQLDPTNPVLRVRLGGAYAGAQKFSQAQETYRAAIALKPDYANAYYNLAFVYQQEKKYLLASQMLKQTLSLLTSDSDATRIKMELENLRELLTSDEIRTLDESSPSSSEPLSPLPQSPE